jgi:predicted nucleic acid-binding protein
VFTIDANIFVRDADLRDPMQPTCHTLLDMLLTRRLPLICPQILLPEVAGASRRTWNDAMRGRLVAQLVGELPHLTLIDIDAVLAQESIEIAADLGLRGMDAIYVATARRHNCTLITLDDEPLQRAGTIILVRTPAQVLTTLDA